MSTEAQLPPLNEASLTEAPAQTPPGQAPPGQAPPDAQAPAGQTTRRRQYFAQSSLFILIALFIVVFSALRPQEFANWGNFSTILYANAVTAVVGLGALLPLLSGEVDISIGGVMGVSGVFVAWAFGKGWPIVPAVLVALAIGAFIGIVNAVLVVRVRLNSFISTLAMTTVLTGIATLITGGGSLYEGIPVSFNKLVNYSVLKLPLAVIYTLVLALVISYVTSRTAFGRRLRATGAGRDAAALIGIRTARYVALAFIIGGVVSAFGGVIETAELQSASPTVGSSFMLTAIAAVFLGSVLSRRSHLNVWGTLLAVLMLGIGITGLTMVGAPAWVPDVFNGAALIAALMLSGAGRSLAATAFGRTGG
jgi:ribose transport system permease protein